MFALIARSGLALSAPYPDVSTYHLSGNRERLERLNYVRARLVLQVSKLHHPRIEVQVEKEFV